MKVILVVGVFMGHGWILIECMGNAEPTLVFDRVRPRRYSSIRRRDNLRSSQVTAALFTMVGDVAGSRSKVRRVISADKNESLMMVAHPVEGPAGSVYGVQVWVGLEHELPPPRRLVGAFLWDPATQLTHHGPTIETEILGIADPQTTRVSPEVFKYFEAFPREGELGTYVADIMSGSITDGEAFDSDITIRRDDGDLAQVYMTMRAVKNRDDTWGLRGIVHDITDVREPSSAAAYNRRTARVVARLVDGEWGIGHVDFATGIVTEWLTEPPAPLDRWATQNAEFHPDEVSTVMEAQIAVATERVPRAEYVVRVRFSEGPWHGARITLTAATAGSNGHGLMRVESASREGNG